MKLSRVLLIGPPFLYELVDEEILHINAIAPIYSYKQDSCINQTKYGVAVFYEELSEKCFFEIIDETKPDAIVCYNDNFLIQIAKLRDLFGISGMGSREIIKFKIKSEMYKVLEGIVSVPKTIKIEPSSTSQMIANQLGKSPYFIKPENLAGAEGICYVPTLADLEHWIRNANQNRQYVIQNFYDLPLVHCELYVQDGTVVYIQPRRYSYPNHKFLDGKIIASLPIADEGLNQLIEATSKKVAKSMNYKNGVMHTEFFVDKDNSLIFLETNIRQAGGAINLIHKKRAGLSMETAMILLELERDLKIEQNYSSHEICGYVPMKRGKVVGIEFPPLKGKYHFDVRVKIGEICRAPQSASNTSVAFIGSSGSLHALEEDFRCLESNSIIKYQNIDAE